MVSNKLTLTGSKMDRLSFKSILLSFIAVSIIFIHNCFAQNWPQWRGPNRDGKVENLALPAVWPDSLKLQWKVAVGQGRSSPIVANDQIFVHTRHGEDEVVSCLNLASGSKLWSQTSPAPFSKNQYAMEQGEGPFSTPVFHQGKLYTLGIHGHLSCFDAATGKVLWQRAFAKQVDTSKLFTGTAMSPVIDNGLCMVHVGDDTQGALMAYDAETGVEKWRWSAQGPGYASPIIVEIDGTRQVVTLTDAACIGVAVHSGELLWQFPFEDEWHENIVTPVVYDGMLILSGVRKGTLAIQVRKRENGWTTETVWYNAELTMYMSSPVVVGDLLFGFSQKRKGQFFGLNLKSGAVLWQSEGREGFNAALVVVGDIIFGLTTEANLMVMKPSSTSYEPIKNYKVANSPTWAHPVILGKQILIKDDTNLALWRLE